MSNHFLAASGVPHHCHCTAPHRTTTQEKPASPPRRPTTPSSHPGRGCKRLGEMRSKGLVPPPISHRPRPGRSPYAELPERTIIYCRAPSKRGASSTIITPYQNLPQATGQPARSLCSVQLAVAFVHFSVGLFCFPDTGVLERLRGKGRSISEVWKEGCPRNLRWYEWRVRYRFSLPLLFSTSPVIVQYRQQGFVFVPSGGWSNWLAQMLESGRRRLLLLCASFVLLSLLGPSNGASNSTENLSESRNKTSHTLEVTPKVSFQLKLHALFHWSSFGFLMPLGIILVRMSSKCHNGRCIRALFYCHAISQTVAVLLATGGAVLSLMNFENSFSNSHQRVGLALYGVMWLQPIIGFFRPERGVKVRSLWYFFHWFLGIAICATGIVNVYIGLRTYHERTTKSVRLWTGLLTVEVTFLAFFYLMIDRWSYMMKQGHATVEQLRPTDNRRTYPTTLRKELALVQE